MQDVTVLVIPERPGAAVVDEQAVLVAAKVVGSPGAPVGVHDGGVVAVVRHPAPHLLLDHVRAGDPVRLVDVRA